MFKLLMSWNIRPGYEEEFFEFYQREFGPKLAEIGVRISDAWVTYYGDYPQFLTGGLAKDLEDLKVTLSSDDWHKLKIKLLTYVVDYSQKIVRANGEFQL